ncbi:Energy-coupling factor transporter transmembrane protein EcfT [bioreactor metagenome]|uniref:Energy-coupling factor transporter transmembrane protein EcfT n=1 Tax=bioreactor metagenome TaxID=1076179 RepID=A0A644U7U2_9ZZZZ|nr:cobalt ECF transporter T component CbiQ [Negativicutes bacterium]
MNKIEHRWLELRHFDELAAQDSLIHQLHPGVKVVTTLLFIVMVASFSKYELVGLFPMFIYPAFLIGLGNIPVAILLKRVLLTLPFVLFIGIFNPFLDQATYAYIGSFAVSGGLISFISILLRFTLSVSATLLLVATTSMDAIGLALSKLRVPRIIVIQILFMYRYIYVLIEEVMKTIRAHSLRAPYRNGVGFKVWGSLVGLLLLRTLDRAQRIYQAMMCRGFDGQVRIMRSWKIRTGDIAFLVVWTVFFVLVRLVNIPHWLGRMLLGGFS